MVYLLMLFAFFLVVPVEQFAADGRGSAPTFGAFSMVGGGFALADPFGPHRGGGATSDDDDMAESGEDKLDNELVEIGEGRGLAGFVDDSARTLSRTLSSIHLEDMVRARSAPTLRSFAAPPTAPDFSEDDDDGSSVVPFCSLACGAHAPAVGPAEGLPVDASAMSFAATPMHQNRRCSSVAFTPVKANIESALSQAFSMGLAPRFGCCGFEEGCMPPPQRRTLSVVPTSGSACELPEVSSPAAAPRFGCCSFEEGCMPPPPSQRSLSAVPMSWRGDESVGERKPKRGREEDSVYGSVDPEQEDHRAWKRDRR